MAQYVAAHQVPHPPSMAGATGLEPATSGVTGRRSNQLSYAPAASTRAGTPTPPVGGCQAHPGRGPTRFSVNACRVILLVGAQGLEPWRIPASHVEADEIRVRRKSCEIVE